MKKVISSDYLSLKRSISSYADKFPSPDRETNREWFRQLAELKPHKHQRIKGKKYYAIRDKIILSNGGFAMKYVMRYSNVLNDDASISELFQEATLGIIEAVDTFDISLKTSFTTYAYFHIRKRIIDFIKHNKLVRAPRDIARNIKHVNEAQDAIMSVKGYEPTILELQDELKNKKGIHLKESIINSIIVLLELNSSGYEESFISEYKDQLSTDEESDLFRNMELNIMTAISNFPERIQDLIRIRYGIGREFPHSPEEVRFMMNPTKEEEQYLE